MPFYLLLAYQLYLFLKYFIGFPSLKYPFLMSIIPPWTTTIHLHISLNNKIFPISPSCPLWYCWYSFYFSIYYFVVIIALNSEIFLASCIFFSLCKSFLSLCKSRFLTYIFPSCLKKFSISGGPYLSPVISLSFCLSEKVFILHFPKIILLATELKFSAFSFNTLNISCLSPFLPCVLMRNICFLYFYRKHCFPFFFFSFSGFFQDFVFNFLQFECNMSRYLCVCVSVCACIFILLVFSEFPGFVIFCLSLIWEILSHFYFKYILCSALFSTYSSYIYATPFHSVPQFLDILFLFLVVF